MDTLFAYTRKIATLFLRLSLGIILFWIGALKFADPSPVVGLLQASLPFLASPAFVYLLGALEVIAAVLLFAHIQVKHVGLLVSVLFLGTLTIFVIAPAVSFGDQGFPFLPLIGQFLLKDLGLLAATVTLVAMESEKRTIATTVPDRVVQPR